MNRQKLEKANKLIKEIDKYCEVKDFMDTKLKLSTQCEEIVKIDNIRIFKSNNGYRDFEIDRELSDKILSTINTFIEENIDKLNKEFREL